MVRSSVDFSRFNLRKKADAIKEVNMDANKIYVLYVGRGGLWRKGLDRFIKIGKELHNINSKVHLIIIGPKKTRRSLKLINSVKEFSTYFETRDRNKIPYYYALSDLFFCFSRYEGGAPVLTLAEAMASGCLVVCSRDSEQEVIENNKNGIIINSFEEKDAQKILNSLKKRKKMVSNALKDIKEFSIEKWGNKYFEELINGKNL